MAVAGIIPVFGWGAKAAKAGVVAYKVTKGINAADHALDAYKSTKAMDILKQTETGLYGLTAANGLGEAVTGKDMFGNETHRRTAPNQPDDRPWHHRYSRRSQGRRQNGKRNKTHSLQQRICT